ncbi:M28 family metallopeptidase [Oceanirhabdus sp. W0125-5]|uniref:M28 family metallopeptidase n=1 Tax=Oceanirhabdus sp. W0125-5 TaxID=2999116 RepID=UPI0022F2BF3F|nr:M28 family metallopeptidase [Oceanirhabdus sp. W0125-5]WBW99045.1 M28 family metallopeptidase [Oceanirhabdus sp. W0125-5]
MFKRDNNYLITLLIVTLLLFSGCTKKEEKVNKQQKLKESQEAFKMLQEGTDVENVMAIIKELTDEKYEGRLACTKGNELAGEYIANYFKEIGLEQMQGIEEYKDYYTQKILSLNDKPLLQVKDKNNNIVKEYDFLEDFNVLPYPNTKVRGEVISELYYVESEEDFSSENDKLKNKILLISEELSNNLISRGNIIGRIDSQIEAKGVIFEIDIDNPNRAVSHFTKSVFSPDYASYKEDGIVVLRCESEDFKELIDFSKGENNQVNINIDYVQKEDKVANIVGIIPGKDKDLKYEYIVFSAHFDHLGNNFNGTYNPGALDNASGVAIIMEIARALKENNIEPDRSILFVAFNGEEEGLVGSKHFMLKYQEELRNSVGINFDMVGHKNDNPIQFYYSEKNELVNDLKEISKDQNIKITEDVGARSDHDSFQKYGIPGVTIIEWENDEYHHYTDTIDKLDKNDFKILLDMIYTYICNEGV